MHCSARTQHRPVQKLECMLCHRIGQDRIGGKQQYRQGEGIPVWYGLCYVIRSTQGTDSSRDLKEAGMDQYPQQVTEYSITESETARPHLLHASGICPTCTHAAFLSRLSCYCFVKRPSLTLSYMRLCDARMRGCEILLFHIQPSAEILIYSLSDKDIGRLEK